jgi:hypothetical protein
VIKNLISLVGIIILFAALFTLLVYIWLLNSSTIFERRESPAPPPQQPAQSSSLPESPQRFAVGSWPIEHFPLASTIIWMT